MSQAILNNFIYIHPGLVVTGSSPDNHGISVEQTSLSFDIPIVSRTSFNAAFRNCRGAWEFCVETSDFLFQQDFFSGLVQI